MFLFSLSKVISGKSVEKYNNEMFFGNVYSGVIQIRELKMQLNVMVINEQLFTIL